MESKQEEPNISNTRLQALLQSLSKCKIEFAKEREELTKVREVKVKLEAEVKETRELEKSYRYQLQTSREMIGNLQETVSQLVYLKRDIKKLKEEVSSKDSIINALQKEKEILSQQQSENINELKSTHDKQVEVLKITYEKKVQQVQNDSDTQIAQYACVIEELRSNIKDMETEHRDKMNVVVLEYEEKIQRGAAQIAQLQEQLTRQAARTDSNIDAYRRRLEELEEKLKQSQFKQYLAQSSYPSQYESQVERPYSVSRDPYPETCSVGLEPVYEGKAKFTPTISQNKAPKPAALQVMYYGNKTPGASKVEKKGQFNITKKRKLYNEKDFQDF
ncbi:hypothetical protein ABMA27_014095 [Loxostege sticticalis]|uniref:Uncharacterized protein n=1 Tax=Loxostege sticticalis TaxID=481309 RepID=A0ABR3ICS1_LOXSC